MNKILTNEFINNALNGIDSAFVQEMLTTKRLDRTALKRFASVAIPVAATAAVVALCFGFGRVRMLNAAENPLLK